MVDTIPALVVCSRYMRSKLHRRGEHMGYRKPDVDDHIIALYTKQHLTLRQIGVQVGMSAQGVQKRLQRNGITSDQGEWVETVCDFCGSPLRVTRSRWRSTTKNHCNPACYYASLENPGYHPCRQGQRLARALVAQHFPLLPDHVVHHWDGNTRNNDRSNLAVFASQSDHMAHHRGRSVAPIWDGRSL
jgi:hypothetical protein